ncbi:hypothetical protein P154DRAFT_586370 [Amniculicola lignicola CBS 123094]|uniref:Mid2 domain-containing protein n=1 Tax=Amniculicola lignicola CBS 123094 TaxID=1392246 RepID=A0A6A5WST0_9PLEO|nr:hypothetical protein P154DRAFT_586370 [Amniculicola lignicola CBS 123094]
MSTFNWPSVATAASTVPFETPVPATIFPTPSRTPIEVPSGLKFGAEDIPIEHQGMTSGQRLAIILISVFGGIAFVVLAIVVYIVLRKRRKRAVIDAERGSSRGVWFGGNKAPIGDNTGNVTNNKYNSILTLDSQERSGIEAALCWADQTATPPPTVPLKDRHGKTQGARAMNRAAGGADQGQGEGQRSAPVTRDASVLTLSRPVSPMSVYVQNLKAATHEELEQVSAEKGAAKLSNSGKKNWPCK